MKHRKSSPALRSVKNRSALLLSACALGAIAASACSPKVDVAPVSQPVRAANSACDRHILKVEDLAGILTAPITQIRPLPGDAQSCEFATAAFAGIIVSVRPGVGRSTVEAWTNGKMPLDSSPLPGVGDAAVWQETLHEVVAQKNALLCDIQVRGGGSDLAMGAKALPAAVGSLCNKIFAAI